MHTNMISLVFTVVKLPPEIPHEDFNRLVEGEIGSTAFFCS